MCVVYLIQRVLSICKCALLRVFVESLQPLRCLAFQPLAGYKPHVLMVAFNVLKVSNEEGREAVATVGLR